MDRRNAEGLQILASAQRQRDLLRRQEEGATLSRIVANVEIPRSVHETLQCNPKFAKEFFIGVGRTLHRSMNDLRTRPTVWSDAAAKERLALIYDMIERIHGEGNVTIKMTMDRLWEAVLGRMLRAEHPDDAAEQQVGTSEVDSEGTTARMWSGGDAQSSVGSVRADLDTPDFRDE